MPNEAETARGIGFGAVSFSGDILIFSVQTQTGIAKYEHVHECPIRHAQFGE